jgi:hypothetical protein
VQLEKRCVHLGIEVGEKVAIHDEVVVAGLMKCPSSRLVTE